jgi:hypothetical protein
MAAAAAAPAAAARNLLALFLCLLRLTLGKDAAAPFVSYTFTEHECNEALAMNRDSTDAPNSTPFIRSGANIKCAPSFGVVSEAANTGQGTVSVSFVSSRESLQEVFRRVVDDETGLSIEVFFKPADALSNETSFDAEADSLKALRPIITIGRSPALSDQMTHDAMDSTDCGTNRLVFQLAQRGDKLEVMFRSSDDVFEACQRSSQAVRIKPGQLAHVVVSMRENQQNVYVNNRLETTLQQRLQFRDWMGQDETHLSLFSYPMKEAAVLWQGTIHKVAMYPKFLAAPDVASMLKTGLPSTSPVPINATLVINEDAEIVPNSHPPGWYLKQAPLADAERIVLRYGWVDYDLHTLQTSALGSAPIDLRPIYTYVTKPPATGCLYQVDGALIGCGNNATNHSVLLPVVGEPMGSQIVYLPPFNQHSATENSNTSSLGVFATIEYCVSDKVLISVTQCKWRGSLAVIVSPVNDPPVTYESKTYHVMESSDAAASPKMHLSGYEVDIDDSIQNVQVTKLPSKGSLLLSVTTFRKDRLRHGTPFEGIRNILETSSSDPVYALYLWNASLSLNHGGLPVQGTSVTDSFKYRVADTSGAWSNEQTVHIKIVSAIACQPPPVVSMDEDSHDESTLEWFANDTSDYKRDLQFFVESVPAPELGTLIYSGRPILSGQTMNFTLPYPYKASVSSAFHPASNYCTGLERGRDVAIRFHVVALEHRSRRIVSVSDAQIQRIEVLCFRDELKLTVPPGPFSLSGLTLRSAAEASRRAKAAGSASTSGRVDDYQVAMTGIKVQTVDSPLDVVNVTVSTESGYLSFNRKDWQQAAVHSQGRGRFSSGSITFLASPVDLNRIFHNLTYQTFTPGNDSLAIRLEYGNCAWLNRTVEFPSVPASNSCQILSCTIPVVAEPDSHAGPKTRLLSGLHWQLLQLLVSMICFPALFLVVSRVEDKWSERSANGGDDAIMDGDDDETVFDASDPVWIQYRCPDTGDYYYQNREDGTVTWMAPLGDSYVPWSNCDDFYSSECSDDGDPSGDEIP